MKFKAISILVMTLFVLPLSANVSETWESSPLQSVFNGSADLTWTGDISSFAIEAANWPGNTDFGDSTEKALRSSNASTTVNDLYTIVTDISSTFDEDSEVTWNVYVDGNSISIQSGYWYQMVLLANTNSIADIESPTAAFEGYKLSINDVTIDGIDSDYLILWKCDSSDTGWVMVEAEDVGSTWLQDGWNIQVTRSSSGLWTIAHGEGSKTAAITTDYTVSESTVDTSGSTWYSGMSWRTKGNTLHYNKFGFDDFAVTAISPDVPPVANAGSNQSVTDSDGSGSETVTLDASGSSDSDGTIVSYQWTEDGIVIATGSQPSVNLSCDVHEITLTVTDDDNLSDTDTVTITVLSPPVAFAGLDQTVTDNDDDGYETVSLSASGSIDLDGSITSYVWSEGGTQIATGSSDDVSFAVGTHEVTLTVTDNDSLTDTDTVTIIVEEAPSTGITETFESSALQSVFNGTADLTWTGDIASFAIETGDWTGGNDFGGSAEKAIRSTNASTTVNDLYTIVTDVSDEFDPTEDISWKVYVDGQSIAIQSGYWFQMILLANTSTIADIESPNAAFEGYKLTITEEYIDGVDSDFIVLWKCDSTDTGWVMLDAADLGNAWLQAGWNLEVTRESDGTWNVSHATGSKTSEPVLDYSVSDSTVDVTGSTWYSGMSWRTKGNTLHYNKFGFDDFYVGPADVYVNEPPVAYAGGNQAVTDSDNDGYETITLDGTGSTDNIAVTSYTWSENGTAIATGAQPSVSLAVGTHDITLTVEDEDSATDTDSVTVSVSEYDPNIPSTTSITQYGITWTFSTARQYGQFVNGDYWVIGPVTISSVSPAPASGKHGSMLNPSVGDGQAYDIDSGMYDATAGVTYPVTLTGNNSLMSSVSWVDGEEYHEDIIGSDIPSSRCTVRTAAVLTILNSAPPADAFRPPYSGTSKPIYRTSDIDYTLMPNLDTPNTDPDYDYEDVMNRDTSITAAAQLSRNFQRPWLLHLFDYVGRQIHPTDNMPGYHREVYSTVAAATAVLLTDMEDINDLLIPFLQLGIDSYGVVSTSTGTSDADSSMHKWPIMLAGVLFDDAGMKNDGYTFRTDWMTYYIVDGTSSITSAIVPVGYTHNGYTVGWRQVPGDQEHEHLDPATEWYLVPDGGGSKREAYRNINSGTWPAMALAAHIMDAVDDWDHDEFFDYVDRWMTETGPYTESSGLTRPGFIKDMWDTYRDNY